MARLLRWLLLLGVALTALAFVYPPVRLAGLVILGRGSHCSLTQAMASWRHTEELRAAKDRILAASRRVKQEANFTQWETPYGLFWIPHGNDYVLPFNLAEQELKIYGTGEQAVRPGDVVLDCGASFGVFTREALRQGARLVVAIELAPDSIEVLKRNFAEEIRAGKVIVYEKGVWDRDDELTLYVDPQNSAANSVLNRRETSHASIKVPLTTIDKLVAELKLERVDYIKMDIEGAEQRALRGARDTIRRFRPRLSLSAYHDPDDPRVIPELVKAAWDGYRMECGPCADGTTFVRPDILYFR